MRRTGNGLILTTALTGALGLLYWYVAARMFPAAAVGRAGALVSATALFSGVGTVIFGGAVMRFLLSAGPHSRRFVVLVYGFSAALSTVLTIVALLILGRFGSAESALRVPLLDGFFLCLGVMMTSIFVLEDSVLTGARAVVPWVPAENAAFGILKLLLLLLFVSTASSRAIYLSWILPMLVIVPCINVLIFRRVLPPPTEPIRGVPVNPETRRAILRFVRGDASGSLLRTVWFYTLPLIVTAMLGPVVNAQFYVSFVFCMSISLLAANLSSALIVHGANSPAHRAKLVGATLRRVMVIQVPLTALLIAAAPLILKFYGPDYVAATGAFRLMLLATIPNALLAVFWALCRLQNKTHLWAAQQAFEAPTILASTAIAAHFWGLTGVAAVQLAVPVVLAVVCLPALLRAGRRTPPS